MSGRHSGWLSGGDACPELKNPHRTEIMVASTPSLTGTLRAFQSGRAQSLRRMTAHTPQHFDTSTWASIPDRAARTALETETVGRRTARPAFPMRPQSTRPHPQPADRDRSCFGIPRKGGIGDSSGRALVLCTESRPAEYSSPSGVEPYRERPAAFSPV